MAQPNQRFRIDHWIVAILFFAMALIAFINILSRYLFHFSFASTEDSISCNTVLNAALSSCELRI